MQITHDEKRLFKLSDHLQCALAVVLRGSIWASHHFMGLRGAAARENTVSTCMWLMTAGHQQSKPVSAHTPSNHTDELCGAPSSLASQHSGNRHDVCCTSCIIGQWRVFHRSLGAPPSSSCPAAA